jgi:hypothetical protein
MSDDKGREVLVPKTLKSADGTWHNVSDDEAWAHYEQTGENLGMFSSPDAADAYGEALHNDLAKMQEDSAQRASNQPFNLVSDQQTEDEVHAGQEPSYLIFKQVNSASEGMFDPRGMPLRVYFNLGAEQQRDEGAWRKAQSDALDKQQKARQLQDALSHSLETGVQVPPELMNFDIGNY